MTREQTYNINLPAITLRGTPYGSIPQAGTMRSTTARSAVSGHINANVSRKAGVIMTALDAKARATGGSGAEIYATVVTQKPVEETVLLQEPQRQSVMVQGMLF